MRRALGVLVVGLALIGAGCGDGGSDAQSVERSAATLTDARVGGLVSAMELMALSTEVRSTDWDTMLPMLAQFQESAPPLAAWFVLPDGSYHTVSGGAASANLSDRPYFPRVMAGEVVVGDLVVSRSTGRKSMIAVVPVLDGGDVVGALGISLFLAELSQAVSADLGGVEFAAITADGVYGMHLDEERIAEPAADAEGTTSPLLGWVFVAG